MSIIQNILSRIKIINFFSGFVNRGHYALHPQVGRWNSSTCLYATNTESVRYFSLYRKLCNIRLASSAANSLEKDSGRLLKGDQPSNLGKGSTSTLTVNHRARLRTILIQLIISTKMTIQVNPQQNCSLRHMQKQPRISLICFWLKQFSSPRSLQ